MVRKLAKKRANTLYYEVLEERVLYSADAAPGLDPHVLDGQVPLEDTISRAASLEQDGLSAPAVQASVETHRELVIVNPNIDDYEQLIADLQGGDDNRIIEVALLDPNRNGIEQVSEILAQQSDLSAVHFITHGADGQINLGNDWLNNATLLQNADQVAAWGNALTDSGDILFYGCNVAAHDDGRSLVDGIARLTGADVAASDDLTGDASLGGNWDLEYQAGNIDSSSAADRFSHSSWSQTLASIAVPGAQTAAEDTSLVFNNSNGNTISIAGNSGQTYYVALSVTNGSLSLSGTLGLTFADGDGADDASMSFSGSLEDINTALEGLDFSPTSDFNGSATLTVESNESSPSLNADAALLGHYSFDATGALGTDTSPAAGYPGTPVNATAVNDAMRGDVMGLAGNGYIQTSGHFGNPADLTLAAWVNLTAADTNGADVISLGDNVVLRLDEAGNNLAGFFYNGSTWEGLTFSTTLAGTGWHHVAFTFSNTDDTAALYLDGTAVDSGTFTSSISYTLGADSFIGKHGHGSTGFDFNGQIDDARIYGRPLSAPEIGELASAGGSASDTDAVTITVTPVNDAPAGADNTVTIDEDTVYTFTASDFGFSDVDGNNLSSVWITTLPGQGQLMWNGSTFAAGNWVAVVDINAGQLTYTPAANGSGAGYTSFTFQVEDDGGTANGGINKDPSPNIMTIDVTPVNDAPIGADHTVTIYEDTVYTFTAGDFGFSDVDGNNLSRVWITTLPAQGQLMWNGATFAAGNWVAVVDIDAGQLTYVPVANASGTGYTSFTFQVEDDGGTANGGVSKDPLPKTMTIDVTPVNDAPVGSPTITGSAVENQTLTVTTTGISDADGLGGFSYQWLRDGSPITGATSSTYTLTGADVGAHISVQVGYTDGQGTDETLTSAPSAPVIPGGVLANGDDDDNSGSDETVDTNLGQGPTDGILPEQPHWELTTDPVVGQDPGQDGPGDDNASAVTVDSDTNDPHQFVASADDSDTGSRGTHDAYVRWGNDLYKELYFSKHVYIESAESAPNAFDGMDTGGEDPQQLEARGDYDLFRQQLDDAFHAQMKRQTLKSKVLTISCTSFTAGIVSYFLRTSSLVASLLSSLPAWRRFDPIAVFAGKRKKQKDRDASPDADESGTEAFFDDGKK